MKQGMAEVRTLRPISIGNQVFPRGSLHRVTELRARELERAGLAERWQPAAVSSEEASSAPEAGAHSSDEVIKDTEADALAAGTEKSRARRSAKSVSSQEEAQ